MAVSEVSSRAPLRPVREARPWKAESWQDHQAAQMPHYENAAELQSDMQRLGADFGYTMDGGELGALEDETFSADGVKITIHGISVHPGAAKGKQSSTSSSSVQRAL